SSTERANAATLHGRVIETALTGSGLLLAQCGIAGQPSRVSAAAPGSQGAPGPAPVAASGPASGTYSSVRGESW
ncbi:MAG TPA: hypothetical protein VGR08_09125, partial [Thermomicrobiales bacterium]|nr:hypothetical protein [Thermomicrobiales bacterium]